MHLNSVIDSTIVILMNEHPFLILNEFGLFRKIRFSRYIGITCPCNEDPLKPHFYIEKLGFTGVFIFFLFLLLNINRGYSLEPPHF